MNRYFFASLVLLITGVSSYLAQNINNKQPLAEEISIGLALCLSGECSEWGENSRKGAELAAKQINASGGLLGKKLQLIVQDTAEGSSAKNAISAYRNLITKKVSFIVGPSWTPAGLALAQTAKKSKDTILISPSLGVASFNETADNIFNTWPHDSASTQKLAEYAYEQGLRKAVILSSQQPWETLQAENFAATFKSLGGHIVKSIEVLPQQREQREALSSVPKINSDFIFFANFQTMDSSARILKTLGYKGLKFAALMDETRSENAHGAFTGCIFPKYPNPAADFSTKFSKEFGEAPGITSDTAYDTVMLYAQAIRRSRSLNPKKVKETLAKLKLEGASGHISFDALGGVIKSPLLYQVTESGIAPL